MIEGIEYYYSEYNETLEIYKRIVDSDNINDFYYLKSFNTLSWEPSHYFNYEFARAILKEQLKPCVFEEIGTLWSMKELKK